jgi:hypothetical protein
MNGVGRKDGYMWDEWMNGKLTMNRYSSSSVEDRPIKQRIHHIQEKRVWHSRKQGVMKNISNWTVIVFARH